MLPALRIGGVYTARVRGRGPDGRVRLELGGMTVAARCALPLCSGDIVEVEVDRIRPEVVLRVTRQSVPDPAISAGSAE